MLDNLLNLVREFSGDAIVKNPSVPNEHNDAVISTTTNSIIGGLQNAISAGGFEDVLNLLGGKGGAIGSNPLAQNITGGLISELMSKFNFNQGTASQVANGVLPHVLNNLVQRTNDSSNSSFNLNGLMGALTGGKTSVFNLQSLVDSNGDDHTDMQDIMNALSGEGRSQSGSLMDLVKG